MPIEPPEIIEVGNTRVSCDGGDGSLGHPRVYLEMGDEDFRRVSILRPANSFCAPERRALKEALPARPIKKGDHLYLIDGSGYLFRAYHALPPLSRKSDGLPTGAVSGFSNMLWKLLQDMRAGDRPTHLAVIFDAGKTTFRNTIYRAIQGEPSRSARRSHSAISSRARRDARFRRRLHRRGGLRGRRSDRDLCTACP